MSFLENKSLLILLVLGALPVIAQAAHVISTALGGTFTSGYQGAAVDFVDGDKMRGHVMLKNGFTIPAEYQNGCGVTVPSIVTWDADGKVCGSIILTNNNSILNLQADLRLGATGSIAPVSAGVIQGNSKTLFLGGDVRLNDKYVLVSDTAPLTIDGGGHVLTFINSTFTGRSVELSTATYAPSLILKNMIFALNNGNTTDAIAFNYFQEVVFENMTFMELNSAGDKFYYNSTLPAAVSKNLLIKGDVYFKGRPGSAIDLYGADIIIEKNSTLHLSQGLIIYNVGSVTMRDSTSVLHLNGCNFYTGNAIATAATTGMTLTKGTVLFENQVKVFNKRLGADINTDMTNALIFGDGTVAGDVNVRVLSGAFVTVDGCMQYNHS